MFKFADDTTVVGLISGDDDVAYTKEVLSLTEWCSNHSLELNFSKTKELVVDFHRRGTSMGRWWSGWTVLGFWVQQYHHL